jgi:phage terminase small subunit
MRGYAADAARLQLDLLVSDEQAPLLADCVRLGKVGRPTILGWKRQHEELMARAAEEKAKAKSMGGAGKKTPVVGGEGEDELEGEGSDAGSDASRDLGDTIHVKPRKESPRRGKGKGKGKARVDHPDMGEPVNTSRIIFLPCAS